MAKTKIEWMWDKLYTIDDIVRYEFANCGYSENVIKRVIKTLKKSEADKRQIVEYVEDVEKEKLFNNIDDVIAYLQRLKSQGYTNLDERWSGYEDNYIVACKNDIENNEEFFKRICKNAYTLARTYSDEEEEKKKIQSEINKKQKEIEELKKKL